MCPLFLTISIPLFKLTGNKTNETGTLFIINSIYEELNKETDEIFLEARELAKQGTAKSMREAISKFEQAQKFYQEIGNKEYQAACLGWLGSSYNLLGNKTKALELYNIELSILDELGDTRSKATTLHNMGEIYSDFGETNKALEHFNQALLIYQQLKDKDNEAGTLNGIGKVYSYTGESAKALQFFNQSLEIFKEVEDNGGKALVLNNIGFVYSSLGEYQKALEYFEKSLPLRRLANDKIGEAYSLDNIGRALLTLNDGKKAFDNFLLALKLFKETGYKSGEAIVLFHLGEIGYKLKLNEESLNYFRQSLAISTQVGDKKSEAATLVYIGGIYSNLGDKVKQLEYLERALPIFKQIDDKRAEADLLTILMSFWSKQNNSRLGIFYGKESVKILQEIRISITTLDKETQKNFLKDVKETYRYLADALIKENRLNETQQVFNLFKDQQFFDFNRVLSEPSKQLLRTTRETETALQFEKTNEKLRIINSQLQDLILKVGSHQPTNDEIQIYQRLSEQKKATTAEFGILLKQAESEFSKPPDEKDKVGDVPDTREMQTTLRNLNQQTGQKAVAVYTLVGEDKYHALIVSPDGIKAVSFPMKGVELNEKAKQLWGLLQSDSYDTTVLSKQIYDVVFKPLENELPKDTTTIMWSLDGNLRYIPMAALWDGKQFLAERFNHVNFTRADSERMLRNLNPNWTATGFGTTNAQTVELLGDKLNFSALPGVTEELKEIFKQPNSKTGILTGEVLPDAKFTKISFLESMKQRRPVVHIASHFSFRPGDEARSFLLLGDGAAFTLNDMKKEANLFQGVDLLTLSVCNTAATQADANGREVDGFAELAQRLGAGAVMATLWSVSDASTPWLMRDFYANKQANKGMTKTEALRKAQLALLNGTAETKPLPENEKGVAQTKVQIIITPDGKRDDKDSTRAEIVYVSEKDAPSFKKDDKKPFAHPYYWSPFVLIGNWR